MKSFHDNRVNLWDGDCREVLAGFEANSFDACVTDPPYHFASIVKRFAKENPEDVEKNFALRKLPTQGTGVFARASRGFMGKAWDGGQIAHEPETWAAVLRVLKPGAHLVAFHAPKNWHRLALAIEEAGFEIRDNLLWLFGSGFPKSHNVSKAIDKALGQKGRLGEYRTPTHAGNERMHEGYQRPWRDDPDAEAGTLREYLPGSDLAIKFNGFGSSLKPAYEPIVLARKPLSESTIAANVMEHGTGAINIDACRVGTEVETWPKSRSYAPGQIQPGGKGKTVATGDAPPGRWPANLIHDGSKEVVEGFPETGISAGGRIGNAGGGDVQNLPIGQFSKGDPGFGDTGSAARFFYTSKADKHDRTGSRHPTVKPIDLMQWLVRLVTPPKGHIIDCFAGTGTTAEAAMREGFRCTLIEREPEYLADIERRMALVFEGEASRSVAMAKLQDEGDALPLFAEAAE